MLFRDAPPKTCLSGLAAAVEYIIKIKYKLGELGEVSFGMLKLGDLGEVSFRIYKLGEL